MYNLFLHWPEGQTFFHLFFITAVAGAIQHRTIKNVKDAILNTLTPEARNVLASRFSLDFDLYNYLRQRIHRQAKELGIS